MIDIHKKNNMSRYNTTIIHIHSDQGKRHQHAHLLSLFLSLIILFKIAQYNISYLNISRLDILNMANDIN